jgi:hypothetical protein
MPNRCCCCARPNASSEFRAAHTRTTGKKVVKHDTREWSFPLCGECRAWMRLQKLARVFCGLFFASVAGAIGVLLVSAAGSGLTTRVRLSVGLLAIGVAFLAIAFFKLWREKQVGANTMKPAPDCRLIPVRYDGWNGSVHHFRFTNEGFVQNFAHVNRGKLVG